MSAGILVNLLSLPTFLVARTIFLNRYLTTYNSIMQLQLTFLRSSFLLSYYKQVVPWDVSNNSKNKDKSEITLNLPFSWQRSITPPTFSFTLKLISWIFNSEVLQIFQKWGAKRSNFKFPRVHASKVLMSLLLLLIDQKVIAETAKYLFIFLSFTLSAFYSLKVWKRHWGLPSLW